jgi:hypothetical protein
MLLLQLVTWAGSVIMEGPMTLNNDPEGLFGWTREEYIVEMLLFAAVVGFFTICGYNYAVKYVPPLIFSVAGLADAFLTGLTSWMAGLEDIPPLLVWIGGTVAIGGGLCVIVGGHRRAKMERQWSKIEGARVELVDLRHTGEHEELFSSTSDPQDEDRTSAPFISTGSAGALQEPSVVAAGLHAYNSPARQKGGFTLLRTEEDDIV